MPTLAELVERIEAIRANPPDTPDGVRDALREVVEFTFDMDKGMFELDFAGAVGKHDRPFVMVTTPGASMGIPVQDAINLGMRAIMAAQEAERDVAMLRALLQALDPGGEDAEGARTSALHLIAAVRHFRSQADPSGEGGKETPAAAPWAAP